MLSTIQPVEGVPWRLSLLLGVVNVYQTNINLRYVYTYLYYIKS